MLHDTGDEYVGAVTDSVNLQLLTHDILINQYGLILVNLYGCLEVVAQSLLVRHNLHSATTQYVAWTYQYGVADALSSRNTALDVGDSLCIGLRDTYAAHDSLEALSILSVVDSLDACADNLYAEVCQWLSKVDSCLTTE